jgi:hypothetical protein
MGGSPYNSEVDYLLCSGYQQLGTLVQSEEGKSGIVDRVQ